jgi:hypothetical protein
MIFFWVHGPNDKTTINSHTHTHVSRVRTPVSSHDVRSNNFNNFLPIELGLVKTKLFY